MLYTLLQTLISNPILSFPQKTHIHSIEILLISEGSAYRRKIWLSQFLQSWNETRIRAIPLTSRRHVTTYEYFLSGILQFTHTTRSYFLIYPCNMHELVLFIALAKRQAEHAQRDNFARVLETCLRPAIIICPPGGIFVTRQREEVPHYDSDSSHSHGLVLPVSQQHKL